MSEHPGHEHGQDALSGQNVRSAAVAKHMLRPVTQQDERLELTTVFSLGRKIDRVCSRSRIVKG
jgi:hypothetical protein